MRLLCVVAPEQEAETLAEKVGGVRTDRPILAQPGFDFDQRRVRDSDDPSV